LQKTVKERKGYAFKCVGLVFFSCEKNHV